MTQTAATNADAFEAIEAVEGALDELRRALEDDEDAEIIATACYKAQAILLKPLAPFGVIVTELTN